MVAWAANTRDVRNDHTVHRAVLCGGSVDKDDPYGSLANQNTAAAISYSVTSMVVFLLALIELYITR